LSYNNLRDAALGVTRQILGLTRRADRSSQLIAAPWRHGRFSGHGRPVAWIAADIVRIENGRLAEHWDVLQDAASKAESKSGLPTFGATFPTYS
jgi:hypothetical protein